MSKLTIKSQKDYQETVITTAVIGVMAIGLTVWDINILIDVSLKIVNYLLGFMNFTIISIFAILVWSFIFKATHAMGIFEKIKKRNKSL